MSVKGSNFDAKPIRVVTKTNTRLLNRRQYFPNLVRLETADEVINRLLDLEDGAKALGYYETIVVWCENRDYLDAIETDKHTFEDNEKNEAQMLEDQKKELN